jgi:hypothetical protein
MGKYYVLAAKLDLQEKSFFQAKVPRFFRDILLPVFFTVSFILLLHLTRKTLQSEQKVVDNWI